MNIKITNWDKYNPRKDLKSLTWIRLDGDIGFSESLFGLNIETKWLWIFLLSYSSKKNNGDFEIDLEYLCHHSGIAASKISQCLDALFKKELISIESVTSQTRSDSIESVTYERTNDTNERNDTPGAPVSHWLVELWNKEIKGNPKKVISLNDKRKKKINQRLKEYPSRGDWETMIKKINESTFCQGLGPSGDWVANFDWLIREKINCDKLLEGNFDNKKKASTVSISSDDENIRYQKSLMGES